MMALADMPATSVPTRKAPLKASTPMLIGRAVATTNMAPRAPIEIQWLFIGLVSGSIGRLRCRTGEP